MANVFTTMVDTIFADPNMTEEVIYRAFDDGDGLAMRAQITRPDVITDMGDAPVISGTVVFEIRTSELATPAAGDTVEWQGIRYEVQGTPVCRDSLRLYWQLDVVPQ